MQITQKHRKTWFFILLIAIVAILWFFLFKEKVPIPDNWNNWTWNVITIDPIFTGNNSTWNNTLSTWNTTTGQILEEVTTHEVVILSDFVMKKSNPFPRDYPQVIFKNIEKIKNPILVINATFTDDFERTYQYDDASWYFFALKVFMWSFDNGGYYDVFRNEAWWVKNSSAQWLDGAKSWREVAEWVTWEIPLFDTIKLAVEPEERKVNYQFKYLNFKNYIMRNQWNPINIWAYLSSTKEMKWRNLMYINEMKIVYEGFEWDITVSSK